MYTMSVFIKSQVKLLLLPIDQQSVNNHFSLTQHSIETMRPKPEIKKVINADSRYKNRSDYELIAKYNPIIFDKGSTIALHATIRELKKEMTIRFSFYDELKWEDVLSGKIGIDLIAGTLIRDNYTNDFNNN